MKKETLSEALGMLDEKYVAEAEKPSVKKHKTLRIALSVAACFVLVAAVAVPTALSRQDTIELSGLSQNVKVKYADPSVVTKTSYSLIDFKSEDELFTYFNTAVFKGTVREIRNIQIDFNGMKEYRAIAEIEVEAVYRGDCKTGETVGVLLPCTIEDGVWVEDTEVVSAMRKGTKGIFMPVIYDENSFWEQHGATLCQRDLAPYGFADGVRYAFLETDDGLLFDRYTYESIADAQTLDEIEAYVVKMIEKTELTTGQ